MDLDIEKKFEDIDMRNSVPEKLSPKQLNWRWCKAASNNSESNLPQRPSPAKKTAYLDGLRGFAALLVYILHYTGFSRNPAAQAVLESGFGYSGNYLFATIPGIRIFFTGGHLAVTVFFVISGYALSYGPLRYIHAGDSGRLVDSIGSALFRRWFRLFIPVACTTFVWMTSWHLFGIKTRLPQEKSFCDEVWMWYYDFKNFSFIFTGSQWSSYNFHTWSVLLEFRGSIVIYTTLIALRHLTSSRRLICEGLLIWYFLYIVDGWYCALFMVGMFLCDYDKLVEQDELPPTLSRLRSKTPSWVFTLMFAVGLYFGGVPSVHGDLEWLKAQPGWYFLSFMKPQAVFDARWYYRFIGASLIMIAVPRIAPLKRFFENSFCQYLGRVSFGFYLIHGPVLWSLGERMYAASGRVQEEHAITSPTWINYMVLPDWGMQGMELNHLAPHLIILPATLWAAELVTRFFDEPSVRLSHWLLLKISADSVGRK